MALNFLQQRALDAAALAYQRNPNNADAVMQLNQLISSPEANKYVLGKITPTAPAPAPTPTPTTPLSPVDAPTTPSSVVTPTTAGIVDKINPVGDTKTSTAPTIQTLSRTNTGTVIDPTVAPSDSGLNVADILKDYLDSDPRLMLGAALNAFRASGAAPNFLNWFERNFDSFWTRYLGVLGAQAAAGQTPNVSFVDYIRGLDTSQQFFGTSARDAGRTAGIFADFVRTSGT